MVPQFPGCSCSRRRQLSVMLIAGLGLTALLGDHHSATGAPAVLQWKNGDELSGQIVGATKNRLIWRSAALSQEMSLDFASLAGVRVPEDATSDEHHGTFRFHLAGDQILAGELQEITAQHVVVKNSRYGIVTIERPWLDRIKRSDFIDSIDLVDTQADWWRSMEPAWNEWQEKQEKHADWKTDDPEQISTTTPGARLFLPTSLPDICHIELEISSTTRPAFSLAIGSTDQLKFRTGDFELETWADELVVQTTPSQGAFEHLLKLTENTRELKLRVFWDRIRGRLLVYDHQGQRLAESAIKPTRKIVGGGVVLENKGRDLIVKRLRIDNWIGKLQPQALGVADRLRTSNGREYHGTITGPDSSGQLVVTENGGGATRLPVDQIAEILLPAMQAASRQAATCELEFHDGTRLQGELLSLRQGVASLAVAFSKAPINVRLDRLRFCKFNAHSATEQQGSDYVLEYRGLKLHGNLAAVQSALGWRPVGSDQAIPLQTGTSWEIRRTATAATPTVPQALRRDVLYLLNGDQVPCRVHTIDHRFVTLDTDIGPARRIPRSVVRALEFSAESMTQISGFASRQWQFSGNQPQKLERSGERVVFRDRAQMTHPELLKGGMCEFDVQWSQRSQSALIISLTSDTQDGRRSRNMFYLIFSGEQCIAHVLDGSAGRRNQISLPVPPEGKLRLRFQVRRQKVELLANGDVVGSIPFANEASRPTGVTIACQQMNSRNQRQVDDHLVIISNLRAGRATRLFHGAAVADAHQHVMTVPRSRRQRPPKHVLVAANGDLLRGELLAMGPSSVKFRSRMDDVVISRDRLSGIVWLADEEEIAKAAVTEAGMVQATFRDGVVLEFSPERVVADRIIGRHDVLGVCQLSLDSIDRLHAGKAQTDAKTSRLSPWTLVAAPDPVIPGAEETSTFGTHSALLGEPAADFELGLLGGGRFRLSEHRGKIVVLDFWTTWCGPCIQSLPQLIDATSRFPIEEVLFVGVNQQENEAVVNDFMESRNWNFTVALDENGAVGQSFQLEGYPQTVVVGSDGLIEHVRLGASPDLQSELTETLSGLLSGRRPAADQ